MIKYRIVSAEPRANYELDLVFADGSSGTVDLSQDLWGPMFVPLKEPGFFEKVMIDECGAVCWPNGADLAPDALYQRVNNA